MLKKVLLIILLSFFALSPLNAESSNGASPELPQAVAEKADSFVVKLFKEKPDVLYSELDQEMKNRTNPAEIKKAFEQIQNIVVQKDTAYRYSATNYYPENKTYALAYDVKTGGVLYELKIVLTQRENTYAITGFHLGDKPRKLFDLKDASFVQFLVFILFVLCVLTQAVSVFFFLLQKNLGKKKWLYLLSSIVGFPIGIGVNWTTGVWIVRFGFNVPAVGMSAPANYPDIWTVTAWFPLGLYFMIQLLMRKPGCGPADGTIKV